MRRSKGPRFSKSFRAAEPLSQRTTSNPQFVSVCSRIVRLFSLSSATKTRRTFRDGNVSRIFCSSVRALREKKNREPSPSLLSNRIFEPIFSTSKPEMANPRPVPPYLRVMDSSPCEKTSNNLSW